MLKTRLKLLFSYLLILFICTVLLVSLFAQGSIMGISSNSRLISQDKINSVLDDYEDTFNQMAAEIIVAVNDKGQDSINEAKQDYISAMPLVKERASNLDDSVHIILATTAHLKFISDTNQKSPDVDLFDSMKAAARTRSYAIARLAEKNPTRARKIAEDTLRYLLDNTQKYQHHDLSRALEVRVDYEDKSEIPPPGIPVVLEDLDDFGEVSITVH